MSGAACRLRAVLENIRERLIDRHGSRVGYGIRRFLPDMELILNTD